MSQFCALLVLGFMCLASKAAVASTLSQSILSKSAVHPLLFAILCGSTLLFFALMLGSLLRYWCCRGGFLHSIKGSMMWVDLAWSSIPVLIVMLLLLPMWLIYHGGF